MRPPRLVPLYLLVLFPILTTSRQALAFQWEVNDQRPTSSTAAPQGQPTPDEVRGILKALGPGDEYTSEFAGAAGRGAGVDSQGEKIDQQHTGSPPRASLTDIGNSEGGGSSTTATLSSLKNPSVIRLICGVLSIACVIGAGIAVWRQWRLPVLPVKLTIYALSFGACAWFPDIAIAVLAGTTLLDLIDTLFGSHLATRANEALRAVVAGVSDVPADIGEAVRKSIKAHADDADDRTIAAVKFRDRLK